MGKDSARDAAGALTAGGAAAAALGTATLPEGAPVLAGGIVAMCLQGDILAGLAIWDTFFATVAPDLGGGELALALPGTFVQVEGTPPTLATSDLVVASGKPFVDAANATLAVGASLIANSRAASRSLAKWLGAAKSNDAAALAVHAALANAWLAKIEADKSLLGDLCTHLGRLWRESGMAEVKLAKADVFARRDEFLAGKIPDAEQRAFTALRITPPETQAIQDELRQLKGNSLPDTMTLQSVLGLVAPALAQVNLNELLPRGFARSPGAAVAARPDEKGLIDRLGAYR
jgi:hypothetical protein